MSTTTSTIPVMAKPMLLITRERFIRRRAAGSGSVARCRFQCRTMPSWLSVKDTNTPTMYSWISRVTWASKAQISTTAPPASARIPLENASRSPRVCSWRGRNPSRARIEPEHREAVERGVRGEHQDQAGDHGHHDDRRREPGEHRVGELPEHRVLLVAVPHRDPVTQQVGGRQLDVVHLRGLGQQQDRHHEGDRQAAEQREGGRSVAALGLLEGGHAVADRLDSGERSGSRRRRRAAPGTPRPAPRAPRRSRSPA